MKVQKIIFTGLILICVSVISPAQDKRAVETSVADLLTHFPSTDISTTNKLMNEMLSLGDAGMKQICNLVLPLGTGDDMRPRYAIESLTRYLSQFGKETDRNKWEQLCISYAVSNKDYTIKDFFMKQLQLVGTDASVEALKVYLTDRNICSPAVAAISSTGSRLAEKVLSEALKDPASPCAAAVMNALASMKSDIAVNEFIAIYFNSDRNVKASALNALAQSGSQLAMPVLSKAAKEASYNWEQTGATASLLVYARRLGSKGDVKAMERICGTIIRNCNVRSNIQYKTAALETLVNYFGYEAMRYLIEAAASSDKSYRNAGFRFALSIPGTSVTRKWIEYYPQAIPAAKPEIISMLGLRKDVLAVPLITTSLTDSDINVRMEAAAAVVKINGREAIPYLIDYMNKFADAEDQEAAKSALMTVTDDRRMPELLPVLRTGSTAAIKTAIDLLAWGKGHEYFDAVLLFTDSPEESIRAAAYQALGNLAGPGDQEKLIDLLARTEAPLLIADVQIALENAANQINDPERRSDLLIRYILNDLSGPKASNVGDLKIKIIPVLARTGGREALVAVSKAFENGNADMRDICFKALTSWKDHTASSALYEICASGNKKFEGEAFEGYVRQIKSAPFNDEQRLLLLRKIMPFAKSAERKNQLITEIGRIKTYQALFFLEDYLKEPLTSSAAASAIMHIALPAADSKSGMYGANVRIILSQAINQLKGPESEYNKELISKYLQSMQPDTGFVSLFNGKDLTGWQGLVENPVTRAKMKPSELAKKQADANKKMAENWSVKDGCIWFNGNGDNLCSVKEYADFEFLVDWKITKKGDSGIYLRGSPQVQIWDTSRVEAGAQVGSGGLYNNQKNPDKPLKVADNPVGDWNSFRIIMTGEKVSVWLNGVLVVDNVTLENYWDRKIPIFPKGPIELQAHGTDLAFRDIYVREIK